MLNIDDFTVMNKFKKLRVFSKWINYKNNNTHGGKSLMWSIDMIVYSYAWLQSIQTMFYRDVSPWPGHQVETSPLHQTLTSSGLGSGSSAGRVLSSLPITSISLRFSVLFSVAEPGRDPAWLPALDPAWDPNFEPGMGLPCGGAGVCPAFGGIDAGLDSCMASTTKYLWKYA